MSIGVAVDAQDHVWIVHRPDTVSEKEAAAEQKTGACCSKAPPVLEFDRAGNLIGHWGGPGQGYEWPESNHGITIDYKGNVWIGGNGTNDAQILKFTQDGKFLAQYGHAGKTAGSNNTENFGRVAKIFVDPKANEAYISDGYLNKRVAVLDADTGKFKRYWGAYGNKPDDKNLGRYDPDAPPAQQFRNPVHCAELSNDGFLYVRDRNDPPRSFNRTASWLGKFSAKRSLDGSVRTCVLRIRSRNTCRGRPQSAKVYIVERQTLEV
jgi:DNA-binding beta-propeller fold protein YncE